jgi:hypothetical protein
VYTGKVDWAPLYRGTDDHPAGCVSGEHSVSRAATAPTVNPADREEADSTLALSTSIRDLLEQAALTVSGHLRPGPDPACESALRAAFVEFDAELAEILGHRDRARTLH